MSGFLKDFRIRLLIVFYRHTLTYHGIYAWFVQEVSISYLPICCYRMGHFCMYSFRFTISLAEPPNVLPLLNLCVPSINQVENEEFLLTIAL